MSEREDQPLLDPSAIWLSGPLLHGSRLVLLLHGLGGDEADIAALVPWLPQGYTYAAPRGLFPFEQGWAWTHRAVDPSEPGRITASAEAVERWLDELEGVACVGAVGFSQGGILALHLMRRAPGRLAWVVQLSGGPFPGELPGDAELKERRPPVFWGHGGNDPTLPPDAEAWVRQWMVRHTTVHEVLLPHLGHDVDEAMGAAAAAFIAGQG